MEQINNVIQLIENEQQKHGNTKERVASVLRLIVAELGKKVNSESGKSLSANDFTNELKEKLEELENVDISGKLDKGTYTGNAQQLKNEIDGKVDKEVGKGLSTKDFTNDLYVKLKNLDVASLLAKGGYMGTAKDLDTEIKNLKTLLTSDNSQLDSLQEIVDFVEQNKSTLDTLGITNIAGLQRVLDEKAPKEHNHSYNDLNDKPTIIPEAPSDGKKYARSSAGWVDLKNAFEFGEATELGTTDLNTVLTPGVYWQSVANNATTARNYPTDNIRGGSLRVLPVSNAGQTIVHQLYVSGGTDGSGSNAMYYREDPRTFLRKYVNGRWVGWFELTQAERILVQTVANFSTDTPIEEFPQDGATVLLPEANVTIQLKKDKRNIIRYIQTSNHTVTFTEEAGITAVGNKTFDAKVGREIQITLTGNKAYIQSADEGSSFEDAPTDNNFYARKDGTWSMLDFFLTSKGIQELGTQNLNDLKTAGIYRQNRGQDTTKARNYPTENIRGGTLWVLPISESPLIIHQLLVTGGTSTSGENTVYYIEHPRIFMRKWVRSQKWSEWVELTTTNRVLTASTNTFTTKSTFDEYTQDKATVLLSATASTITVEGGTIRQQTRYIQTENVATTFVAGSGVTIVGEKVYQGKRGTFIDVVIKDNTAYITSGDGNLEDAPNDNKDYLRSFGQWKPYNGFQFRELSDNENLNNIKQAGLYGQYNSQSATVARNFPYDAIRGGHLMVLPMTLRSNLLTVFQVYWSAGTLNQGDYTNHARIFMRAFVNNSQWLPWIEFNGGKVHEFMGATQNLASAFNNAFPNSESTFVLKQATTVTINRSRQVIRYVKDTDADITFTGASGVNVVGGGVVNAPKGTLITVVCYDNNAYVCYDRDSKEDSYVIPVTSNLVLDKSHVGRTLQFNNNSNITIDITNFPTGAMLSGVKNSGNGTVTFIGTTAPTTDNVLNGAVNSSFSLVKNGTGESNLLINNL